MIFEICADFEPYSKFIVNDLASICFAICRSTCCFSRSVFSGSGASTLSKTFGLKEAMWPAEGASAPLRFQL